MRRTNRLSAAITGGNIHGRDAVGLMNDLIADPAFAALMKQSGLEITVTDTFRHVGVMKSDAHDLGRRASDRAA